MKSIGRILLLPFSLLYGLGVGIRNFCYDTGILTSRSYRIPIISVGNLSVGGTGKSPHIEFLVEALKNDYRLATLSRGYKRKTSGFQIVERGSTATEVGDEPLQFKLKFPDVTVAVDESRRRGIETLLAAENPPEIILLDDAYQHRKVKAGLNLLLTDYSRPYIKDFLLPAGSLREWISGSKRADIVVVTKSPEVLSPIEIRRIKSDLKPKAYQEIYFSYITYQQPIYLQGTEDQDLSKYGVLLVTGIANPAPLHYHLKRHVKEVQSLSFGDHHQFVKRDYKRIRQAYDKLLSPKKMILMTEKDAMRFNIEELSDIPIAYLPIKIKFHGKDQNAFIEHVIHYVERDRKHL